MKSPDSPRNAIVVRARIVGGLLGLLLLVAWATLPSATAVAAARGTPGTQEPARQASPAPNPCTYVTAAQAASILHVKSVVRSEAPLGPTCIFRATGQKIEVTLAVEALNLKAELHTMKGVSKSTISGHLGYCGRLGNSMLLVPVHGNFVLVVTAPCGEARALATIALHRLKT